MNSIFKYPLDVVDKQTIPMPKGAVVLSVQVQDSGPCLWAWVNPEIDSEPRTFFLYTTGEAIPLNLEKLRFIGTFQMGERFPFVGHVFVERLSHEYKVL